MFELISLWIFNLLYPEQKSAATRKSDLNNAAAFFYGTSFESIEKEKNIQTNPASGEQASYSEKWDPDDWPDL